MLFRPLSTQYGLQEQHSSEPWPAMRAFLETQKHCSPPFAIISQTDHAGLAGEIAASLQTEVFGELPPEVVEAIRLHDFGWVGSDNRQFDALAVGEPRPFPAIPAEESSAAWQQSIRNAELVSPLAMVLVSRHFETLSAGDSAHKDFSGWASGQREPIEKRLGLSADDLARWTGALGFCDLLSLYLCCGSRVVVALPLCHPAQPGADSATKVALSWQGNRIVFSRPIVRSNSYFSVNATLYRGRGMEREPLLLEWMI